MDLYFELLKYPIFTLEDVCAFYNNQESARTALKRLLSKGRVMRIRRNLYTAISGETGGPVANRFQIASAITKSAHVSHHSAMEYYGITDQVFFEVYVGSETPFQSFQFDGYAYHYVHSKFAEGIENVKYSSGIRVTDRERTLLESIKDMDKIAGPEEVLSNIENMNRISEDKMLKYLDLFNNQFLYQKTGYLLSRINDQLGLSADFFDICRIKAGKSSRYLSSDFKNGTFDADWSLVVPQIIFQTKNGGRGEANG